ncbi:MAG: hypothetical protein ACQETH_17175, partial [Candidatus Rifleibacteriota bacterium]
MINIKRNFAIFLIAFAGMLVGCGIPGSPNAPVIDDSVTLTAKVSPPAVNSDNLLGSVKFSPEQIIDIIAERG